MIKSYPIQRHLLKLFNNEKFFESKKPDFIELGSVADFNLEAGFEQLLAYVNQYDWTSTEELTTEKTFRNCIRIQPAMPEVFGPISESRKAPYCEGGFNFDQALISSCQQLVRGMSSYFTKVLESEWTCTSIQLPGLLPGSYIEPHVDGYLAYQWSEKIHLPLVSNEFSRNVAFSNDATEMRAYKLEVGKFYIINNLIPHSAFNFGDAPRVHLIFDLFQREKHTELRNSTKTLIYNTPVDAETERLNFFSDLAKNQPNLPEDYRKLL